VASIEVDEMIKAIIFDFGGVVYKDVMKFLYEKTGEKFHIEPKLVKKKSKPLLMEWQKNKISSEEFWKQLASRLKISDSNSLKEIWDKTFIEHSLPNEKTIEIVKKLKMRGYKVAALSNIAEPHATYHRKKKHYEIFPQVFLSFELGMAKPEKEIYEYAARMMDVGFEECVFIDDDEVNLETAKKLGMKTILFQSPEQLKKDLKKLGVL
jgi:putative hydrolase of the HAD superfamily